MFFGQLALQTLQQKESREVDLQDALHAVETESLASLVANDVGDTRRPARLVRIRSGQILGLRHRRFLFRKYSLATREMGKA